MDWKLKYRYEKLIKLNDNKFTYIQYLRPKALNSNNKYFWNKISPQKVLVFLFRTLVTRLDPKIQFQKILDQLWISNSDSIHFLNFIC